jgi:rhamnosyltransferase
LAVAENQSADIILFMTQDAVLQGAESLARLLETFDDPEVGAAYGRQLPFPDATPFAAHARRFNYPPQSRISTMADVPRLGIKATFISNSFAAYRLAALHDVGSFPQACIVSEDTYVTAKMLKAGWALAYCAEAQVFHSHNYSLCQEFKRYFDIGVFHSREPWVQREFAVAEAEGRRFVISEMKYLLRNAPSLLLLAVIRTLAKYIGFRMGLYEDKLPVTLKSRLSMQPAFWRRERH